MTQGQAVRAPARITRIGKIFIAVMLIVLLEGAARKWVSGGLTVPLVALRDILAAYAVWYAARRGFMPMRSPFTAVLLGWSCCVIAWALLQVIVLQSSPVLMVIGLRFWLLYYWFAYACAAAMTREDFRRSAFVLLWIVILSMPLVVLQQMSPPGALINLTPDTDERDIFVVVAGVVRPTATFSFTLGYTTLLAIALPVLFMLPGIRGTGFRVRTVFLLAFACILLGTFLSGSRGAIVTYGAFMATYLLATLWFARGPRKLSALVTMLALAGLALGAAMVFSEALQAITERFQLASEAEDFTTRLLSIFTGGPAVYEQFDWLGAGLGKGSNLAGYFQSGERTFLLAEDEPARILMEAGVLGALFLMLKVIAVVLVLFLALRSSHASRSGAPAVAGIAAVVALLSWSATGQLTVNAMIGVLLTFVALTFRFALARPVAATTRNAVHIARPMPAIRTA